MSRKHAGGLGPTPAAAPLDSMLEADRLRLGNIGYLTALHPDQFRVGKLRPTSPAALRCVDDHLIRGVGHLQGLSPLHAGLWETGEGRPSRRVLREPGAQLPPTPHLSLAARYPGTMHCTFEEGPSDGSAELLTGSQLGEGGPQ